MNHPEHKKTTRPRLSERYGPPLPPDMIEGLTCAAGQIEVCGNICSAK